MQSKIVDTLREHDLRRVAEHLLIVVVVVNLRVELVRAVLLQTTHSLVALRLEQRYGNVTALGSVAKNFPVNETDVDVIVAPVTSDGLHEDA